MFERIIEKQDSLLLLSTLPSRDEIPPILGYFPCISSYHSEVSRVIFDVPNFLQTTTVLSDVAEIND